MVSYNDISSWVHGLLEAAGLVPGVGIIPDAINTVYYLVELNPSEAAWAASAMAPLVGQGVVVTRRGLRISEDALKQVDETYAGGGSSLVFGSKIRTRTKPMTPSELRRLREHHSSLMVHRWTEAHALRKTIIHHVKDSALLIQSSFRDRAPQGFWGLTMHGDDGVGMMVRTGQGARPRKEFLLSDQEVADLLRKSPRRSAEPIFMIVCNGGREMHGRPALASRLAQQLGTYTVAPTRSVKDGGRHHLQAINDAGSKLDPDATFIVFGPDGRKVWESAPQGSTAFNVTKLGREARQAIRDHRFGHSPVFGSAMF